MVKREVGNEKIKLKEKLFEMDKWIEEFDENINEIEKMKEDGKLEILYWMFWIYFGYWFEFVVKVCEVDEGVVVKFFFNSRDENMLVNKF